jgi:hypothetical protein
MAQPVNGKAEGKLADEKPAEGKPVEGKPVEGKPVRVLTGGEYAILWH